MSATDVDTQEQVAVKSLLPGWAADERLRKRFAREVRIQSGLNHPNVMPILYSKLLTTRPYYVMPLATKTLVRAIRESDRDDDWIAEVFLQVLAGTEAAHSKGILHRDIKPQNVLQLGDGTWVLADFGASREVDRTTTTITRSEGIGTMDYMSLQQYQDPTSTDRRDDVFSLGKLLLFMVEGVSPAPFRPSSIPGGRFAPIIDRATQSDPAHRYQSAQEMATAVDDASAPTSVESPRETLERLREDLTDPGATVATVRSVIDFLARYPRVEDVQRGLVPYIPVELMAAFRTQAEDSFRSLLENYDQHVSGGLPFEYCDVVADFYRSLIRQFDDVWLFRLVVGRLLDLGWSHSRWHVQRVVLGILRGDLTEDQTSVAREAILGNQEAAVWTFEDEDMYEYAGPIGDAVDQARRRTRQRLIETEENDF